MSGIWFTSDPHFGHERVATTYRPFGSVEEHDAALYGNWSARVREQDTVYVLGDLCLGSLDYALGLIACLPGTKHLISGNHDACHPMHRGWKAALPRYLEVFETVQPFGTVRMNGEQLLLSHFPYEDDHTSDARYRQWRLPDMGARLIHGHTHKSDQRQHGREIHVGVDAWGFAPVGLGEIERIIREEP